MKIHCLPVAAALALALAQMPALPQASAPQSIPAASAPLGKTGPRLLTPAESRDSAAPPGELRPERRVTPQISIPLGRKPPPPAPESRPTPTGNAASAGADGDAAARCEARRGEQVRAKCRDQLARQARSR